MKIAVDAMGGDYAPGVVIEGLSLTVQEYPDYDFVLVGHEAKVRFYLEKYGLADNPHISIFHAESVCEMSDPSAIALRGKKGHPCQVLQSDSHPGTDRTLESKAFRLYIHWS